MPQQMMKHLPECPPPPAMSVPSPSVCLLTSLPPAFFFLLSLFLPPFFLSAPRSLLSPSLSLALFLFSEEPPSPSVTMELCILQPSALLSPEWTHLLTLPLRIRVFPSMSFCHSSSPSTHSYTGWTNWQQCTNTHQQAELWSGFVYDRERQYQDCFRVVSSHEMYRCQEYVLYVWALGWSHFGKQKISYRMTSSGIKVNYQL